MNVVHISAKLYRTFTTLECPFFPLSLPTRRAGQHPFTILLSTFAVFLTVVIGIAESTFNHPLFCPIPAFR